MSAYYSGEAVLPDGWTMRRVRLNAQGFDVHGWQWGVGEPLWHLSDDLDSCTVRSPSPVAALAIVLADGWPPTKTKRYNWHYHFTNPNCPRLQKPCSDSRCSKTWCQREEHYP